MSTSARELRFRQRWRSARTQTAVLAALVTVAFVLARWLHLGADDLVLRIFLVALGVIGLGLLVAAVLWGTEDRTVQGRMLDELGRGDRPEPQAVPAGLKQATSTVTLALRSAAGRDRWLRAEARAIVEARLALVDVDGRRGPTRDADVALAAQAHRLSPQTWQLIRPDRPADASRDVGLTPDELASILDDLEHL
jgi:hypothetical protein